MCSITLTMSTSEMVSRLSTWTSTPTGIGGPEGKWHHIRNALVLTLFFSKQKVKMTYYKQKVLKKNECTNRNRQGHGLFFLPAYGCDSTHHHFFFIAETQLLTGTVISHTQSSRSWHDGYSLAPISSFDLFQPLYSASPRSSSTSAQIQSGHNNGSKRIRRWVKYSASFPF